MSVGSVLICSAEGCGVAMWGDSRVVLVEFPLPWLGMGQVAGLSSDMAIRGLIAPPWSSSMLGLGGTPVRPFQPELAGQWAGMSRLDDTHAGRNGWA